MRYVQYPTPLKKNLIWALLTCLCEAGCVYSFRYAFFFLMFYAESEPTTTKCCHVLYIKCGRDKRVFRCAPTAFSESAEQVVFLGA